MAQQRASFAKRERERAKMEKAKLKQEKRVARTGDESDVPEAVTSSVDQGEVLARLARLHEVYDAGDLSMEDFETERDALRAQLMVD